jgi:thiamine kinase
VRSRSCPGPLETADRGHNAPIDILALLTRRGVLARTDEPVPTPLPGGYWNTVVRLRDARRDWVVKVYADGDPEALFPILPDDEARALEVLSGHRVAPEPVAYLPAAEGEPAVLVYRFLEGESWRTDVRPVAALMRRQHAVRAEGFRPVPTDAAGILTQGDRLLVAATAEDAEALGTRRPPETVGPATRLALLHTDAGAGNVIVGADGARLIDWQCPAVGDPAEDLFCFLSPAFQVLYGNEPLSAAERAAFLEAYDDREVGDRLDALGPALTYRMGAYCAARRHALGGVDPDAAARYARALALGLADLDANR